VDISHGRSYATVAVFPGGKSALTAVYVYQFLNGTSSRGDFL